MVKVQFFLSRAVWLLSGIVLLVFILGQVLLIYGSWSYSKGIEPVYQHTHYLRQLETVDFNLRKVLLSMESDEKRVLDSIVFEDYKNQINQLIKPPSNLKDESLSDLKSVYEHLDKNKYIDKFLLQKMLNLLRIVINQELNSHQESIRTVSFDATEKFFLAIGLALLLLIVALILWFMVRQRIIQPLTHLTNKMFLLARKNYTELEVDDADPILSPLIEKYNFMANRLKVLEIAEKKRRDALEKEVRKTSQILLQQQYRMYQAERLGAVGELAAGVAHELRNPLMGVKMALTNIGVDIQDEEISERINLIVNEVDRVNQHLSYLLEQARQQPELPIEIYIEEELKILLNLVCYQLPHEVSIDYEIESPSICYLPRNQLHRILLNLILNAGQALKDNSSGEIRLQVRPKKEMLEINIMDNGPGFPELMMKSGIQPFLSMRPNGTGLGLVMVRRTVQDMGGEIHLRNRDEGGACVTLILPCKKND